MRLEWQKTKMILAVESWVNYEGRGVALRKITIVKKRETPWF